jgi:hypothetical protein
LSTEQHGCMENRQYTHVEETNHAKDGILLADGNRSSFVGSTLMETQLSAEIVSKDNSNYKEPHEFVK